MSKKKSTTNKPHGPTGPKVPANLIKNTGPLNYLVVNSLTGPQGTVGATGPQGTVGATGPQGTVGATGPQGTVGATGPQGTVGATGPEGTVGATGPQGTVGATGPQGTVGATGPQGTIGATGPQGTVGATGPQGTVGATGPQGTVGATGPQGTVGATGPQGTVGATGPQGTVGATGPQGTVGATGPQGTVGATGPQGTVGATGPQGTVGPTGPKGEPGIEAESIILRKNNNPITGYTALNVILKGNTIDGLWKQCTDGRLQVYNSGIVADSRYIYIIGGFDIFSHKPVNDVLCFDTHTKLMTTPRTSMPEKMGLSAAAFLNNGMLAYAGGRDTNEIVSNKAWMLNGNSWVRLGGDMKKPVAGGAAVAYNNKLYVFGGQENGSNPNVLRCLQIYDPASGWTIYETDLPYGFSMATAAVHNDHIYVFGGHAKPGSSVPMSILRYNPQNRHCDVIDENTTRMLHGSAAMAGNTIYYISGRSLNFQHELVPGYLSFDTQSRGMHNPEPRLKTPRIQGNSAIVDRKLFIMGGTGPTGSFNTEYIDLDDYLFYLHKKV
ncbi:MAG: Kelch repeat protein [Bacteroidetes bacterium]|nr:Kelch repeat protein [Bacteroidota bacterium]